MTVPGERSFIDTNILIYALEPQQSPKKALALAIMESALNACDGVISFQIVQEFLSVALRKFRPISIAEETGWSFYDSLMVGAALAARCSVILTEDLQHGRRIRGVEIHNPFL